MLARPNSLSADASKSQHTLRICSNEGGRWSRQNVLPKRKLRSRLAIMCQILTKLLEILNRTQTRLAICDRRVHEVLLALLIDGEALKRQIARRAKELLNIAGSEDGTRNASLLHAILQQIELDGDDTGLDFDREDVQIKLATHKISAKFHFISFHTTVLLRSPPLPSPPNTRNLPFRLRRRS